MRPSARRPGVTLLELLIALSISGLAILGGVLLLDQLNDSAARIVAERVADAGAGNGDRLLRRLLADARSSTDSAQRFVGDEHNAAYLTRCDVPSGWSESCRARLMIDSVRDSSVVVAETSNADHFVVRRIAGAATLRYLDLTARDSAWVRRWAASISLPSAIAVVAGNDTTVFALGSVRD
jgi:prepilin-type N-terminal cleavage/methylation domain-containing protein